jgi:hypothetical protein
MAIQTKTHSVTGVGTTEAVDIEDTNDIKIAWIVTVSGTATYTVEHSLDAINYIDNTDAVGQTANLDGNYILPIRSVRAKITSGTGTITLIVRQLVI